MTITPAATSDTRSTAQTQVAAAAAIALPVGGAAVVGALVLAGLGIGWQSLSWSERAAVTEAVLGFLAEDIGLARAGRLIAGVATRGTEAIEDALSPGERAELDRRVMDAAGRGEASETEEEPSPVPPEVGTDRKSGSGIAYHLVIRWEDGAHTVGAAYVEIYKNAARTPRNIAIPRLLQTLDGHDDVHHITGLGLDGVGAAKIGVAYPGTAHEAAASPLNPEPSRQRNVNGLGIEMLNDGIFNELLHGGRIPFHDIVAALPKGDPRTLGETLVDGMLSSTGDNANNASIERGTDYERHSLAAASEGWVRIENNPNDIEGSIAPKVETWATEMVRVRFEALFDADPTIAASMTANFEQLVHLYANGSGSVAEMWIAPRQMEAVIEMAILALDDVAAEVERRTGRPAAELRELQDFYRSILDGNATGLQQIVEDPSGGRTA